MHIVNPSGVKFTNKYLSCFRCLGLGDHGFGGAANEGNKSVLRTPRGLQLWQRNFCSAREQAALAAYFFSASCASRRRLFISQDAISCETRKRQAM